jgi:hypothetical protein
MQRMIWGASTLAVVGALTLGTMSSVQAGASQPGTSLRGKVLSVSDLPAGWSVGHTSKGTATDRGCFHAFSITPPAGTRAKVAFAGASTTFLGETLATGHIEVTRWTDLTDQLKDCEPFTFTAAGKTAKVSVGAMSFPKVGKQSMAYAMTITATTRTIDADVVLFKAGKYVGLVDYGGLGTPDVTQAEKFVDLAVAKVNGSRGTTVTTTPAATTTTTTTTTTTVPPTTTTSPPTTVPPPPTTVPPTTAPAPPPTAAASGCSPIDDEGGCYEPGEYCRNATHGVAGTAGDGEAIVCEDNDGWRWEPTS